MIVIKYPLVIKMEKKYKWYKLDTAANMFASIQTKDSSRVFRISYVLKNEEVNPEILKMSGPYDAEEGCLSLLGGPRPCKRYQTIKVQWQNERFQIRIKTFTGWPAQIIQHEIDHCNGILI